MDKADINLKKELNTAFLLCLLCELDSIQLEAIKLRFPETKSIIDLLILKT